LSFNTETLYNQISKQMKSDIHIHRNPLKGFFYALAGAVLLSTNYITAKYGLKGFNPETFSLVWTSAAAVYSFVIVLATGHRRQLTLPPHTINRIILMGIATGAGMILSWSGLALLDPTFSSFLWRFYPVITIILSAIVLGERLTVKELASASVMLLGGLISVIGEWHIVGTGTVLTLLACLAASVQMLIAKMKVTEIHPNILVFYRVGIATLVIALWVFITGKADFNVETSYWLVTFLGAFLGPCASFLMTFRAYRYWDLSRSTLVLTAQPLFVLPMAYLALGELPSERELTGGFVILIGAFWLAWIHISKK